MDIPGNNDCRIALSDNHLVLSYVDLHVGVRGERMLVDEISDYCEHDGPQRLFREKVTDLRVDRAQSSLETPLTERLDDNLNFEPWIDRGICCPRSVRYSGQSACERVRADAWVLTAKVNGEGILEATYLENWHDITVVI